jgi:hypothetical protein
MSIAPVTSRGVASRFGGKLKIMGSVIKKLVVMTMALWLPAATLGQAPKSDITSVAAAGKVNADVYQNSYFGLTLSAPKAQWSFPLPVSVETQQAKLLEAVYDQGVPERGPKENYTIGLLADSVANFAKGTPTDVYVRQLRQHMDHDNVKTYRDAFPLSVAGIFFSGTVSQVFQRPDFGYYRGLYSTVLNGYFVTVVVQCGEEERLEKLLTSAVKISPKQKP